MIYKFEDKIQPPVLKNHLNLGTDTLTLNSRYIIRNNKPCIPVMGEIHFSRLNKSSWEKEICKCSAGGITVIATYVFWIYHEETEGEYNFTGDNDVREFVKLCHKHNMDVILRIGPWAHGECRNGGFPDWLLKKSYNLRSTESGFLNEVKKWYTAVYNEVQGLLYKDGGNIIGIQLENELVNNATYLLELKHIAQETGFDVPLYTVTGWNNVNGADIPEKDVLPVFGAYPEAPWTGHLNKLEPSPNYFFHTIRNDSAIGTDIISTVDEEKKTSGIKYNLYPFATCELGGGIQVTHHRRPIISPMDIYAVSLVKLGCGNNLPGYYMYHGGTNKIGKYSTFEENKQTGYPNDYPILSYDFQAAIGEYGLIRGQYRLLKQLHMFLKDFGELLAPMDSYIQFPAVTDRFDTENVRCAVRKNENGGFIFVNNHQRLDKMPVHKNVQFEIDGTVIPDNGINIESNSAFILPFNIKLNNSILNYSTCQLICKAENVYFFKAIDGIAPEYKIDEKIYHQPSFTHNGIKFVTLTENEAQHLYRFGNEIYISLYADMYFDGKTHIYSLESNNLSYYKWTGNEFEYHECITEKKDSAISFSEIKNMPFISKYFYELNIEEERKTKQWKISSSENDGFIRIKYYGDTLQIYNNENLAADDYCYNGEVIIPSSLICHGECILVISQATKDFYCEMPIQTNDIILYGIDYLPEYQHIVE